MIQHDEENRGTQNTWHSDVTWRPEPSLGSILRARVVPDVGGDTLFADMHGAYEGLPDKVKHRLDGLQRDPRLHARLRPQLRARSARADAAEVPVGRAPGRAHASGDRRKGIYVNAAFTVCIKDMGDEESTELLQLLYRQAGVPEYQCRLRWRNDTLAFWDNRSTQHYAVSDYWPAVRVMERVTVAGDRPF